MVSVIAVGLDLSALTSSSDIQIQSALTVTIACLLYSTLLLARAVGRSRSADYRRFLALFQLGKGLEHPVQRVRNEVLHLFSTATMLCYPLRPHA